MTTGPESLVKKDVALILQKAGAWIYMSVPHGYGRRGIPDFLGCYLSFMFAIECKATAGMEPSPWQRRELDALRDAGAWTLVVGAPSHAQAVFDLLESMRTADLARQ